MSDEYTIHSNFQKASDDPRAWAEYEYRMGRVREREDDLPAGRGATRHDPQISTPRSDQCPGMAGIGETPGGESGVPADAQEDKKDPMACCALPVLHYLDGETAQCQNCHAKWGVLHV